MPASIVSPRIGTMRHSVALSLLGLFALAVVANAAHDQPESSGPLHEAADLHEEFEHLHKFDLVRSPSGGLDPHPPMIPAGQREAQPAGRLHNMRSLRAGVRIRDARSPPPLPWAAS